MTTATEFEDPVSVTRSRSNQLVTFTYHPEAVQRLARLDGAEFDKEKERWVLPLSLGEFGDKAIADVRHILEADRKDRASIEVEAISAGAALLRENGTPNAKVRINDFHDRTRATHGEIIAANGGYAAQISGFGSADGNAFIILHRQADLSRALFKSERVSVAYNDKGKAAVSNLPPDFDKTLGKMVDGVKVVEADDFYRIEFAFNPDLQKRIRRIEGVEFDTDGKATLVPLDKRDFVMRAVNEMRDVFLKTQREVAEMASITDQHLSGAKPFWAYRADTGPTMSGPIVAASNHIVLQHVGKGDFKMHYRSDLDKVPQVGESVRIKYDGGKAITKPTSKGKEVGYGR